MGLVQICHGVQQQFRSAGNSELVENSEQVVLDRMLAELEDAGDFTISKTIREQPHHILFAAAQEFGTFRIYETRSTGSPEAAFQRLHDPAQILARSPDLPALDPVYASA